MPLTSNQKLGIAVAVGGAAVAIIGVAVATRRSRGSFGRASRAPQPVSSETHANGMTLKHYRGNLSINKRAGILQDLVWQSVQDPAMRKLALSITHNCPARDGECEARAIYNWTRKNIRYTGDVAPVKQGRHGSVEGIDLFQAAKRTVEFRGGDCDDHAVLNATLLALNGITPKFRITAPKGAGSSDWSHIYTTAGLSKNNPSKWLALDTTLPGNYFGVEAPYGNHIDFPA